MLYISGVSGHAGAELSKRAGTRTIQWLMGTSVKCRSNERLRSRGASRNEPMAFEMPMTWHERRWNQWINETKESMHDKWWLNKWSTRFWTWNRPRAHLAMPRACGNFHMFWTKSSSRYRCSSLMHFLRHLCQIETHTRGNTDLPLADVGPLATIPVRTQCLHTSTVSHANAHAPGLLLWCTVSTYKLLFCLCASHDDVNTDHVSNSEDCYLNFDWTKSTLFRNLVSWNLLKGGTVSYFFSKNDKMIQDVFQPGLNCALFGYDAAFFSCPCPADTVSFTLSQLVEYHQNSTGRTRRTRAMSINSTCRGRVFWPWCHIISSCSGMFWNCSGTFCSGMLRIECQTPALTPSKLRLQSLARQSSFMPSWRHLQTQGEAEDQHVTDGIQKQRSTMHHGNPKHSKVPVLSISASLQGLCEERVFIKHDEARPLAPRGCTAQVEEWPVWVLDVFCLTSSILLTFWMLQNASEMLHGFKMFQEASWAVRVASCAMLCDVRATGPGIKSWHWNRHAGPLKVISGTTATVLLARLWWVIVSYCHIAISNISNIHISCKYI